MREFYLPDETIEFSVIAIADFTRKYLIKAYNLPAEKVALIYQGTDVRRFTSNDKARVEANRQYPITERAAPILGSIGSFEHRKGHPLLFEALASLISGPLPDAHLILVGDGPDEALLRSLIQKMGLEKHVSIFPFTRRPNLVYERIDITVLASLYKEGLPNVLLESMSMGVPVVSTNLGGVPEIVVNGKTGYMVEPGNSEQLANAIYKVWADQVEYERMGESAQKLMTEQFDKEQQFDRFLNFFKAL